jgi:DNA-binding transcriptional regulator GbsR (MarR family)
MNDLQRLLPRHHKIIELSLLGMTIREIADEVGMSPLGVSNVINSPRFQEELATRRVSHNEAVDNSKVSALSKIKSLIDENAEKAMQVHLDCLEEEDVRVRQSSASTILNKLFEGNKQEVGSQSSISISGETIQILNVTIQEAVDGDNKRQLRKSS